MMWWAFANCKVGDLHQVRGTLNQTGYHAISSGTQLMGQGFVHIQDNDPKHASKLCQKYIKSKEEQHVIQLMFRPAQSADLHPIEMVSGELDRKVRAKQPTSVAQLWPFWQENWAELSLVFGGKNGKNL